MRYILIVLIIFLVLYLLAITPNLFRRKDMEYWKGKYFAHRGLHNNESDAPENSLAAFELAVEKDFGIELDVHITKDKIPVVFHDYTLLRMCGIDKTIEDLTYKELSEYTLCNSNEHIPTLESVLNLVNGKVPLIIEYKSNGYDISVCKYTKPILDQYKGVYCIESFNPLVVIWYKKNAPSIVRGQLSTRLLKDNKEGSKKLNFILQNLLFNFLAQPDFLAFSHEHPHMLSFKICSKVYRTPAFAWTIRSQEELDASMKHFNSFIFENFIP